MQLLEEIEISYFRSFYKFKLRQLKDLNIIFGKNDSGKSNVIRALNLFFSGEPEHTQRFNFDIDFCDKRLDEASSSEDVRKFLYVKITFNTPSTYKRSLGNRFYVKRQWTVSRGQDYKQEISASIPKSKHHIVNRLLNTIKFIYIPAIKDNGIFEMLLSEIHEVLANAPDFARATNSFSAQVRTLTGEMFEGLPNDVSASTKIGAPTQMNQLFKTLDFETLTDGETRPKSLTRQRGDGIKARHIPELLRYISENDQFNYHLWGFEEPENSLDFVAAQSEAARMLSIAKGDRIQVFMTTHSPSFYLLDDSACARFYVKKDEDGVSCPLQGRNINNLDAKEAMNEGFYLPAVAEALEKVAEIEKRAKIAETNARQLQTEIQAITTPVVLTEGRTDATILITAWEKRQGGKLPCKIRSCETGGDNAGSGNGGAQSLATCLKGVATDHPYTVIGLFDRDEEGIKAYKLDPNFIECIIDGVKVKRSKHGRAYAFLLPVPEFREECAQYENLPIEYLFRDKHLKTEVDGKSLELKQMAASRKVGKEIIRRPLDDVTHFKTVGSGKTHFANSIVPCLGEDAFDAFDAIFTLVQAIVDYDQKKTSPSMTRQIP